MVEFDWAEYLPRRSRELIGKASVIGQESAEHVRSSQWLGYQGASERQIVATEVRLGVALPPSYRAFLAASNGWRRSGDYLGLFSCEDIEWFAVQHQAWIDLWTMWQEDSVAVSTEQYFGSDPVHLRVEYLQDALQISEASDDAVELLIPRVVTDDGEWEHWMFSNVAPGAYRTSSFRAAFTGEEAAERSLSHIRVQAAWPNRSASDYVTALRAKDCRIRRQAVAALEVIGGRRAVTPLIRRLIADPDADVRWNAARALHKLGGRQAIESLRTSLGQDSSENVREAAYQALRALGVPERELAIVRGQLDEAAVTHLLRNLNDPDSRMRAYAAYALRHATRYSDRVIGPLTVALQDADHDVRRYASESIHLLETP